MILWEVNFHTLAVLMSCLYPLKTLLHDAFFSFSMSTFALPESNTLFAHWISCFLQASVPGFPLFLFEHLHWVISFIFVTTVNQLYDYIFKSIPSPDDLNELQVHKYTRLLQIPNNHKNPLSSLWVFFNLLLLVILIFGKTLEIVSAMKIWLQEISGAVSWEHLL